MTAPRNLGAPITGCAFAGTTAAFATGDGMLHLADPDWRRVDAHQGAILCLAAEARSFLTGGDDGRLVRTVLDGTTSELTRIPRAWIEHVLALPDGGIALAARREVRLLDAAGAGRRVLAHPTTVTGIAIDAKARRLAASHYDGVSLWFTQAAATPPRLLAWKGSHIGVALHPAAEAVVSAMQENDLHGWRLPDGHDMRMSGYPAKCESLSFSRSGKWLASAGAGAAVCWPFFGGGPMGKPPVELAPRDVLATRVRCHPTHDGVAVGFADGMVVLADLATQRVLPLRDPEGGAVSALAFSADGLWLAIGTDSGAASLADLTPRG